MMQKWKLGRNCLKGNLQTKYNKIKNLTFTTFKEQKRGTSAIFN